MALNFPENRKEIGDKIRADVQSELPTSNPYQQNQWLWAIVTGVGNRIYDVYRMLTEMLNIWFVPTTYGIYLEKRAYPYGIVRKAATLAQGYATMTGISGTIIPVGTQVRSTYGKVYESLSSATIAPQSISVSTLTSSGTTATAVCAGAHNFASGMSIVVSGAAQTEYNGTYVITVTAEDTFTYTFAGSVTTPATGTILASATFAPVEFRSVEYGEDMNLSNGETVILVTPISGADNTGYVQFNGIGGGADLENDEELRERLLYRIQNPVANFNAIAIINKAREVSFVNRVWVYPITPGIGQVTVYFDKRGDSIIPSGSEVTTVKNKILEILPAHSGAAYTHVYAPTLLTVDFTFSSITPDTTSIRQAIIAQLTNFFLTEVELGVNIPEEAYISTIYQARDANTGQRLTAFTLSSPTGDITVAAGKIPKLGTVSF